MKSIICKALFWIGAQKMIKQPWLKKKTEQRVLWVSGSCKDTQDVSVYPKVTSDD
jgi:hypothetical protein